MSRTQLSNFTFTFHFHELEKEMAIHPSILAWRIPGTGEPGGLPSMRSHRVRHDWDDLAAAAALRSDSYTGFHQATIEVLASLFSFLEALGENSFPCVFQFLEAAPLFWLKVFFLHLPSQKWQIKPYHTASQCVLPPSSPFKDPCDYIEPTWIIQDNLPKVNWLERLIPSATIIPFCLVT